jgi:hypothetical protein
LAGLLMMESGTHRGTALGKILNRTVSTADGDWLNYAWLLPAALGTAVTALLSWSAWITARDLTWPDLHQGWWWTLLRPDQDGTLLATLALWLVSLACYWWPRRLKHQPIAMIIIVAMVVIGEALTTASLVPCRGGASHAAILGWQLTLFLGNQPPVFPGFACQGYPPLAMQLGEILCPGATVIGLLASLPALWRESVGRLGSRFAREATVFTGLSPLTLPLLRRLAETGRSPRDIIVIEPDEDHALLDEARLTGARVIVGDPSSSRLLEPIISGLRGCALSRLYAVGASAQENEKVVAEAARILGRYQADQERRPHLVALIDDPRHADAWRGKHGGSPGIWFEDALSSVESTACWLVDRVLNAGARELLLCGDSSLALAILLELARRAWELAELAKAAAIGRDAVPSAAAANGGWPTTPAPLPVERVLLVDPRSDGLLREYKASVPLAVLESGPAVVRQRDHWHDYLLRALDMKDPAAARETAVIIVEGPGSPENSLHEGGRIARLHPDTPVFVLTSPGSGGRADGGISRPIFGRMIPFEPGLLVDGDVPEDTWRRIAKHWHECYRLSHPVAPGDPRSAKRLPWAELDRSTRDDNILQLRSILTQVAALGRRWEPARLVPPGSFIELSQQELERVAMGEHARWHRRRLAAGRPAGAGPLAVPWADLPDGERAQRVADTRQQLAQLEDVGFLPVLPAGGPPTAGSFERVGVVRAERLAAPLRWALPSGEQLHGEAGDWRVIDSADNLRTVTDSEFRSSHAQLDDVRWQRVGTFRAWPVAEAVVIRTKEGNATARPGDWVVEGPGGERWPVSDQQFGESYRPRQDRLTTDGHASTQAAISSSTAPTIST